MDLNEKLLNVRRANRLLAAYYRRLLDILGLVEHAVESKPAFKLKFVRWDATHHRHIGQQPTSVVGRWGWDFLPIQDATFQWSTSGAKSPRGPGSTYVCVWHQTDNGYKSSDGEKSQPDPTDFAPAEECDTLLHIYLFGLVQGDCTDRWWHIAEVAAQHADELAWTDGEVHQLAADTLEGADTGAVIQYTGWKVRMADLGTEDDVEHRVLRPLRTAIQRVALQT